MKMKLQSRIFYNFLTYSPVFSIWSLLSFIYTVYMFEYIFVLMNPKYNSSLYYNLYLTNIFPNDTYNAGAFLFLLINFCVAMMVISMLRTIFMDPGYLPDPLQFEYKLVKKNLEYTEGLKKNKETAGSQSNSSMGLVNYSGTSEEEVINFHVNDNDRENENVATKRDSQSKRYKFIRKIGNFIEQGPLTSTEFIRYRSNLEKYLNTNNANISFPISNFSALDIQNISGDDKFNFNYEDIFENFRGIDFNKLTLCSTCLRWKVDRAHHCKQCGKCVLKMDHHCPWLANCIGFRNYKFFCLTILYGFLTTLIIFFTFWEVIIEVNMRYDTTILQCSLVTFAYMANFGMLCFLSWLFCSNWTLLFSNQTTIEKSEKERFASSGIKASNYYDQGVYRNFTTVFGRLPFIWFLPFAPNYKGEGIIYDS